MHEKIKFGWTSLIAILSMLLGVIPIVIKAVEEGRIAVNGPEKYLAIFGIVMGAIFAIGRYVQAAILLKRNVGQAGLPNPTTTATPLARARELLSENPGVVQQLRHEGVI